MEMASIGFLLGAICCLFGTLVGRLSGDRDDKGKPDDNYNLRNSISDGHWSGSVHIGHVEQMDPEELASCIRTMAMTGICPSKDERAYLEEAARRIERSKA